MPAFISTVLFRAALLGVFAISVFGQNRLALVIGLAHYPEVPKRPALRFADTDALRMTTVLQKICGVHKITTLLNSEATAQAIKRFGDDNKDKAPEMLFVYFSGHSAENTDDGGLTLYTYFNAGKRQDSSISLGALVSAMEKVKPKHLILFLDGCSSGAAANIIKQRQSSASEFVFASSTADELSSEDSSLHSGVFTHFLLNGLRGQADGALDGLKNHVITVAELNHFLEVSLKGLSQTPVFGGDTTSRLVLSTIPTVQLISPEVNSLLDMADATSPAEADIRLMLSVAAASQLKTNQIFPKRVANSLLRSLADLRVKKSEPIPESFDFSEVSPRSQITLDGRLFVGCEESRRKIVIIPLEKPLMGERFPMGLKNTGPNTYIDDCAIATSPDSGFAAVLARSGEGEKIVTLWNLKDEQPRQIETLVAELGYFYGNSFIAIDATGVTTCVLSTEPLHCEKKLRGTVKSVVFGRNPPRPTMGSPLASFIDENLTGNCRENECHLYSFWGSSNQQSICHFSNSNENQIFIELPASDQPSASPYEGEMLLGITTKGFSVHKPNGDYIQVRTNGDIFHFKHSFYLDCCSLRDLKLVPDGFATSGHKTLVATTMPGVKSTRSLVVRMYSELSPVGEITLSGMGVARSVFLSSKGNLGFVGDGVSTVVLSFEGGKFALLKRFECRQLAAIDAEGSVAACIDEQAQKIKLVHIRMDRDLTVDAPTKLLSSFVISKDVLIGSGLFSNRLQYQVSSWNVRTGEGLNTETCPLLDNALGLKLVDEGAKLSIWLRSGALQISSDSLSCEDVKVDVSRDGQIQLFEGATDGETIIDTSGLRFGTYLSPETVTHVLAVEFNIPVAEDIRGVGGQVEQVSLSPNGDSAVFKVEGQLILVPLDGKGIFELAVKNVQRNFTPLEQAKYFTNSTAPDLLHVKALIAPR